ncbi:Alpha/beta-Hydrolases superfamily protein, partial [Thalictrum thalictroides]
DFVLNSRGSKLFTCKWVTANQEPKALIFICHGFAVHGIDYDGHRKSAGLLGYMKIRAFCKQESTC